VEQKSLTEAAAPGNAELMKTISCIDDIASKWSAERGERQQRRHLDPVDFAALGEAGLRSMIVPSSQGGQWRDLKTSARPICDALRRLAAADPSVALVSSMHPAVIAFWLLNPRAGQRGWEEQRTAVFSSAASGKQWGTITSEPGSGGDIGRTRAVARPVGGDAALSLPGEVYGITGDKHFGSGLGVADWMITSAIPEGESEPAMFALDVAGRPWDGSAGLRLIAEWDGMGMAATQSHAMRLEGAPAIRLAVREPVESITLPATPFVLALFTSVTLGVLDEAIGTSRVRIRERAETMRAAERVEWTHAEKDHWLACQALEGVLRTLESGEQADSLHAALRAKFAVAELAETILRRLSRVHGGGSFSRRSPFAHWFEDVRALGYLRPPWGLGDDLLFLTSFEG